MPPGLAGGRGRRVLAVAVGVVLVALVSTAWIAPDGETPVPQGSAMLDPSVFSVVRAGTPVRATTGSRHRAVPEGREGTRRIEVEGALPSKWQLAAVGELLEPLDVLPEEVIYPYPEGLDPAGIINELLGGRLEEGSPPRYGPLYGGSWWDPTSGVFYLALTDVGAVDPGELERFLGGAPAVLVQQPYSWDRLQAWKDELNRALERANIPAVAGIERSPEHGTRILVQPLGSDADPGVLRPLLAGIPGDAYVIAPALLERYHVESLPEWIDRPAASEPSPEAR